MLARSLLLGEVLKSPRVLWVAPRPVFLRGGITRSPQLAVSCPLPVLEIVLCLKRWRSKLLEMFVTGNSADAEGWGIWELPSCFAATSTSPLAAPSQEGPQLPDSHPVAFLAAISPC